MINKLPVVFATLVLGLSLVACNNSGSGNGHPDGRSSSEGQTSASSADRGRIIGVSFQSMNNPFFVDLNEGLKKVVDAHGDTLVTLDAQWSSLKQKNDISDLILKALR
ncbi:MAG: hypothetical protein WKF30_06825 [Pyrinomonadaceae bacterium]